MTQLLNMQTCKAAAASLFHCQEDSTKAMKFEQPYLDSIGALEFSYEDMEYHYPLLQYGVIVDKQRMSNMVPIKITTFVLSTFMSFLRFSVLRIQRPF